jgi:hypothetical protein
MASWVLPGRSGEREFFHRKTADYKFLDFSIQRNHGYLRGYRLHCAQSKRVANPKANHGFDSTF